MNGLTLLTPSATDFCQDTSNPSIIRSLKLSWVRAISTTVSTLFLVVAMVSPVSAQPADFSEAAERVMPGVVSIKVTKRSQTPRTSQFEEEF